MKPAVCMLLLQWCLQTACAQSTNDSVPASANASNTRIGGRCEGCEAIYESPVAFENLNWQDTLPDYAESGPKLHLSGKVFQKDGVTPAADVVLYIYHTDQKGNYSARGDEKGWGLRHGYIRGWVKTNSNGEYAFYTLRPAAYPQREDPAHIHITIKEPGKNEYYIDDFMFDDDALLTGGQRRKLHNRGGNGILKTTLTGNVQTAQRNIVLGLNVTNYQ